MGVDSVKHHGEALAEALSGVFEYTAATRVAEEVLSRDGGQYQLVGLTGRGATGVFYLSTTQQVVQRRYNPSDISKAPGVGAYRQLQKVRNRDDVEELLLEDAIAVEWVWVHPRWRWAVKSDPPPSEE